jgi:hypothetical protein
MSDKKFWTIGMVKEELPRVKVLVDGVPCDGRVTGRHLDFARVYFKHGGQEFNAEWAWITIAISLNEGRALRL